MKLASQTPKIYIKIFECSENLKEIFFNLKKFSEFFGTLKCFVFGVLEIFDFQKVRKCKAFPKILRILGQKKSKIFSCLIFGAHKIENFHMFAKLRFATVKFYEFCMPSKNLQFFGLQNEVLYATRLRVLYLQTSVE
ncbi:hypothetical protein ASJ80_13645 [Methanobacterium bryantii]|uniref:Uncharacterized protein n=1 Tax=Methanobacterium bryantii TaxID=2161 RepID=A0A2A2H9F9_METBR|nr:hypothetical protein ASJ80_13645 [Methanobacterium bryantii]